MGTDMKAKIIVFDKNNNGENLIGGIVCGDLPEIPNHHEIWECDITIELTKRIDSGNDAGKPMDILLSKMASSLYPPEIEEKLRRLSYLAGIVVSGNITTQERKEHDGLLMELSNISPYLKSFVKLLP